MASIIPLPDPRIRRTHKALGGALLELINERSFDQITIREITARAGVGYASFFRHYSSKDALLGVLADGEIRGLIERTLPALLATDTRTAALALCRYVVEHAGIWSALLTGGAASMVRQEFLRQASEVDASAFSPLPGLPSDLAIIHAVSSTVEILSWWLPRRHDYGAEQVAEILERLIMIPLTRL